MKEKIRKILMEKYQYSEHTAEITAEDLLHMEPVLAELLKKWLETGEEGEIKVQGFSIERLKTMHHMGYPAALLSMDWLLKEPDIAGRELQIVRDGYGQR